MLTILTLLSDAVAEILVFSGDGKGGWDDAATDGKAGWAPSTDGKAGW